MENLEYTIINFKKGKHGNPIRISFREDFDLDNAGTKNFEDIPNKEKPKGVIETSKFTLKEYVSLKKLFSNYILRERDLHDYIRKKYIRSLNSHVSYLNLGKESLEIVPEEVFKFSYLKELDLSDNKLIFVPGNIKNLGKLESLNLANNSLSRTLPMEILELPNLKNLNLEGNNLNEYGEAIIKELLAKKVQVNY